MHLVRSGALVLAVALTFPAPAAAGAPTKATIEKVEIGMTRAEVEGLLGQPDERKTIADFPNAPVPFKAENSKTEFLYWRSDGGAYANVNLRDGKVVSLSHSNLK